MTTTPDAPPFAAFAALRRGDLAPDWISTSVRAAWDLPTSSSLTLIAVSENATFRIDVDGLPTAVLRVHRPGYVVDPTQIAAELTWVRAIAAETSVRVPDVLPLADGSLVHEVLDGAGARWFAVAFAFVRGEILEDTLAGAGLEDATLRRTYAEIGATTAALHDHVAGWTPPAGFSRFGWGLDDALGAGSRWGDWRGAALSPEQLAVCERAETAAREVLAGVEESPASSGLVHADLRPSNIMVDTTGRLTVIDFDDCGTSRLLWDFAAALSFIEHEPFAPTIAAAWLEGYRSVRAVSEEDLAVATALSTVRRLQMLGWTTTHREDALPPAVWAAQVPGTAEVAQRYLDRPDWLLR
ncbi:phosphotransferase enzyme family protein [Kineococcus sp. R86509]|uniref:phosphotransferase enzyme family protein n=1 Tax=Kineococcus sp. R86509 TaxID=3093851 RepID=UPI0036D37159